MNDGRSTSVLTAASKMHLTSMLRSAYLTACAMDVQTLKPGNVREGSPIGSLTADLFLKSAEASIPHLLCLEDSLGLRIYKAIAATQKVASTNTNLGIVLLCTPLIEAAAKAAHGGGDLLEALGEVLRNTTVEDSIWVYRAIRVSQAGHLGTSSQQDIAKEPTIKLCEIMKLAKYKDSVALQYSNGYQNVFYEILPLLLEFHSKWGDNARAVTAVFLMTLAEVPDSLVIRKHGTSVGSAVSEMSRRMAGLFCAGRWQDGLSRSVVLAYDSAFKSAGINPGTTADLLVACLFVKEVRSFFNAQGLKVDSG